MMIPCSTCGANVLTCDCKPAQLTWGERGAQVADDILALINSQPRTPTTEEMMVAMAKALKRAGFALLLVAEHRGGGGFVDTRTYRTNHRTRQSS